MPIAPTLLEHIDLSRVNTGSSKDCALRREVTRAAWPMAMGCGANALLAPPVSLTSRAL